MGCARARSQNVPPSQAVVSPHSSPEVVKSHATGVATKTAAPRGSAMRASRPSLAIVRLRQRRLPSRHAPDLGQHEPRRGEDEAERHRTDLERSAQGSPGREQRDPQRAGERLDPLARVEDGPVAGEEVSDDPKVDEGVLRHPAPRIAHGDEEDDGQRRHHDAEELSGVARVCSGMAPRGPQLGGSLRAQFHRRLRYSKMPLWARRRGALAGKLPRCPARRPRRAPVTC